MRILLFGGSGQLGSALQRELKDAHETDAPSSSVVDLQDEDAVRQAVREARADVVINAAGYTRVDDAEHESNAAFALNATAPRAMAAAAAERGARFVHVSTDYVFDGEGGAPYLPSSPVSPLNVYGESKLAGERSVLDEGEHSVVIRTAWVHAGRGVNFIATAMRVLLSGRTMRVVDDQIGTPTRAAHLAQAIRQVIDRPAVSGLLHFTDAGVASWFDVATCVHGLLRDAGRIGEDVPVVPVGTEEFPRPARRPRVAVLDKHESWARIGWTPPHWRVGVGATVQEILDA
jgi:dTDP-4-dehydrorhamnose reductase